MGQSDPDRHDPTVLLNMLLNGVPFGIIVLDPRGRVKLVNQQARDLLSLEDPGDMTGHYLKEFMGHLSPLDEEFESFLKQPGTQKNFESASYNNRWFDFTLREIQDGYLVIINDITKFKILETDAIQAIITGQENERRRMAREIHDGIGPLLSTAKLELDLFMDDLAQLEKGISDKKLYNIRQTIDAISVDLRDLSHSLIPRLLEEFGLLSAFQNMVGKIETSTNSHVDLYCNLDKGDRFDRDIELNLFRCGQELLNNAIKHSNAGKIILQLIKHEDSIVLMVEDDGKGFDPDQTRKDAEGIGLLNIETRIRALNGNFIIEAEKKRGSLVSIEIPL